MKILITGATGFVGKNLINYLKDSRLDDIVSISRDALSVIEANDLLGVDVVIHLAGKAHDLRNVSDPQEYYKVNYGLTQQLYDAFLKSSASKFIFISSVKAAADNVITILTEQDTPNPQTHYGKSKLMAENYIISQNKAESKSYFILRPCMIHGPGNKGNLNLLFQFVKKGIPYPLSAFDNMRSFLSVENLCFVIKNIIQQSSIASGIYNIADSQAISTKNVVAIIASAIGKKAKFYNIPVSVIKVVARIGDIIKMPLNTDRLNKLTENFCVSNNKIVLAIGKELPVSAKDGLLVTINSFNIK